MSLIAIQDGIVNFNEAVFMTHPQCDVQLWTDDTTLLGTVTVQLDKSQIHLPGDIRPQVSAALTTYLGGFGYALPTNMLYPFDLPVSGLIGYSSFQALVSQSGTSAPTDTVLKNDFSGVSFTLARSATGVYTVTASSAIFTAGKTVILPLPSSSPINNVSIARTSTTVLTITSSQLNLLALGVGNVDSLLSNALLEVRVYP